MIPLAPQTFVDNGRHFAAVFKRGNFGWEYKGKHANLEKAYDQLLHYRSDLQNPPLLVVCDRATNALWSVPSPGST